MSSEAGTARWVLPCSNDRITHFLLPAQLSRESPPFLYSTAVENNLAHGKLLLNNQVRAGRVANILFGHKGLQSATGD